jgi:[acyl-carrier-protein] S-malonyltransferase
MAKTVFLFPGQGSQEIGMARDLFKDDAHFRSLIELASTITGEDLEKLCLKGPEKRLIMARFLQPLLSAVSLGYLRHVREAGITADFVLGHSLGEITALAAAGIVTDQQAIEIAAKRGQLMDDAAAACDGTMMAVLFLPIEKVEELLSQMQRPNELVLANDNAPNQIIVSGDNTLLDAFSQQVAAAGGKCKKLTVSGPWHSPFLHHARLQFEDWAEPLPFRKPSTPIILNATARPEEHASTIKHLVTWQLTSPVYFRDCMDFCREAGVDTFFEIGPGRVLSGLARVNGFRQQTAIFNINNLRGLELAVDELKVKS